MEIVAEAGHMVMMEKPEEVNKLIHNFMLKGLCIVGHNQEISQEELQEILRHENDDFFPNDLMEQDNRLSHYEDELDSNTSQQGGKIEGRNMGSRASMRSVKSIPHDLVIGNIK